RRGKYAGKQHLHLKNLLLHKIGGFHFSQQKISSSILSTAFTTSSNNSSVILKSVSMPLTNTITEHCSTRLLTVFLDSETELNKSILTGHNFL
ncbi:hypothetical protein L9F63_006613, partial [Diploptera punctata]